MKTLLVTGCAGFIGSNFVPYFLEKYSDVRLINLDLLTYAGDLANLSDVNDVSRHIFVQGDICDRPLVESLFSQYDIRGVIHFAAESHVDNSIKNPGVFIQTNINGSFTLIDVAYKAWMETATKVLLPMSKTVLGMIAAMLLTQPKLKPNSDGKPMRTLILVSLKR